MLPFRAVAKKIFGGEVTPTCVFQESNLLSASAFKKLTSTVNLHLWEAIESSEPSNVAILIKSTINRTIPWVKWLAVMPPLRRRCFCCLGQALLVSTSRSSGRHVAVRLSLKRRKSCVKQKNECYYEKLLGNNAFILRRYDYCCRNTVCSLIALAESTYLVQKICSDTHQYPKTNDIQVFNSIRGSWIEICAARYE